jgi:predicted enzyme related to lactoylglutathione lyase
MTTATTSTTAILGRHVWSELMTTDVKSADAFYEKVVGWTTKKSANPGMEYYEFRRPDGVSVGGLMERPKDMNMPPFWSMYIAVPNLEEGIGQVKRLGGSEMSGVVDVPTVGRMEMVRDPQGACFYVIQLANPGNSVDQDPGVGDASWLELMTTDAPAAMKFYEELFHWQPTEAMDMGADGKYQMFNRGSRMIGGMMKKPAMLAQMPPFWGIYFSVPDIDSAVERIKANGGTIMNGPMEVPGGDKIVNALDPQGAGFSLHAKKA